MTHIFIIVVFAVLFGDARATEMTNFPIFILYKSKSHVCEFSFICCYTTNNQTHKSNILKMLSATLEIKFK